MTVDQKLEVLREAVSEQINVIKKMSLLITKIIMKLEELENGPETRTDRPH